MRKKRYKVLSLLAPILFRDLDFVDKLSFLRKGAHKRTLDTEIMPDRS